jgi:hypothetical protein
MRLKQHDFSLLREYNAQWESQNTIPKDRAINFLACLLLYDGRVADVMRYAGNNYTGSYRNIHERIIRIRQLVEDDDFISRYIKVMTTGAPSKFKAESTRKNAMLHWREKIMTPSVQTLMK